MQNWFYFSTFFVIRKVKSIFTILFFSRSFSQKLNLRESVLHHPPYIMKVKRIKLIMCIVSFQNLHSNELNLNVFTNKSIFDAR